MLVFSISIGLIQVTKSTIRSGLTLNARNARILSENLVNYLSAANNYAQSITYAYTPTNQYTLSFAAINGYSNNTTTASINFQTNIIPVTSTIVNQDGTSSVFNYLVISFNDSDIKPQFKSVSSREILQKFVDKTTQSNSDRPNYSNYSATVGVNNGCNNFDLISPPTISATGSVLINQTKNQFQVVCQNANGRGVTLKKYVVYERIINLR